MSKTLKQFLIDNKDFLVTQDTLTYTITATCHDGETYETDCIVKGRRGVQIMIPSLINSLDDEGFYKKINPDIKSLQVTAIQ